MFYLCLYPCFISCTRKVREDVNNCTLCSLMNRVDKLFIHEVLLNIKENISRSMFVFLFQRELCVWGACSQCRLFFCPLGVFVYYPAFTVVRFQDLTRILPSIYKRVFPGPDSYITQYSQPCFQKLPSIHSRAFVYYPAFTAMCSYITQHSQSCVFRTWLIYCPSFTAVSF